jgi:Domain of unknown function (DUF3330)
VDKGTELQATHLPAETGRSSEAASLVPCSVCQREIAASVATWREGSDYVAHYCGLDCYDRWLSRSRNP